MAVTFGDYDWEIIETLSLSAFRFSGSLLGLVSHFLPLTTTHWFCMGFRPWEFPGQSSTVTPWSLNQLLVPFLCGQVPSPAEKLKSASQCSLSKHRETLRIYNELSKATLTEDFRKHSGPAPVDDAAPQNFSDCGNFTLDFKQHGFCASQLFFQTLGNWYQNTMQNWLSSENLMLVHIHAKAGVV